MNDLTQYQRLRPTIKTGDVLAFKGKGWFSRLIRLKSDYSHIAVLVWLDDGGDRCLMICHALYPVGVNFMHASNYLARYKGEVNLYRLNHQEAELRTPGHEREATRWLLRDASGLGYDREGVVAKSTPVELAAKFGIRLAKQEVEEYYCSELAAGLNQHLKVSKHLNIQLSPSELVGAGPYISNATVI